MEVTVEQVGEGKRDFKKRMEGQSRNRPFQMERGRRLERGEGNEKKRVKVYYV